MPPARKKKTDSESPGMQIEVDGRTYVVRESDLTPRLVADLRRETGFAGWIGLSSEAQRGFDLDVLAALVWLARRVDGETVQYDTVLDEMSYDTDLNISVEDKRTKGGESPEA
jgi:hypothetical protein